MKQLCIFSAPKPFRDGHIATIQRNALGSWVQMGPEVEIVLVGHEDGVAEAAAEFGTVHVREVQTNQHGTPLVSAIFAAARAASQAPYLAYVNADILLYPDFLATVKRVAESEEDFVLLGRRYDLDVAEPIEFTPGWEAHLRSQVAQRGRLHTRGGSDYFAFPRLLYTDMPPFAIGRGGWDNWMMYAAVWRGWKPIDASPSLEIVHQNHDYAHLTSPHGHRRHAETDENTRLAGGMRSVYMLLDVPYELAGGRVRKARWSPIRFLRSIERILQPNEIQDRSLRWRLMRSVRNLRFALGGR